MIIVLSIYVNHGQAQRSNLTIFDGEDLIANVADAEDAFRELLKDEGVTDSDTLEDAVDGGFYPLDCGGFISICER